MRRFAEPNFLEEITKEILSLLESSHGRIACCQAVKLAADKSGANIRTAGAVINRLVTAGNFRYVYEYGQSYLEKSFAGLVRLSDKVMVAPPGYDVAIPVGMVMLRINPGAAFGDCRHPTTRLSVRAVDFVFAGGRGGRYGLDIGTGSGILAMAAAALGMSRVLATDIDSCARQEARENIRINRLANRIEVSDQPLEKISGRFDLTIANLRPPTLIRYAKRIAAKTEPGGAAVLSGMKEEEVAGVLAAFQPFFDVVWNATEGGWCAVVLQRKEENNGN
ncbi:MAG: 50S ribosomal protein L11 methyltransferase [Thermodesulfobacteriota bacterium]